MFTCSLQGEEYNFVPLETNVGINMVRSICRDQNGFLWIGNQRTGLMRYDGYQIKRYLHRKNDSLSMSSGAIFSMHEDVYQNLWIGTTNGLNRYVAKKDKFVRYYFKSNIRSHFSSNFINEIVESPDSVLWICTQHGIYKYNREKDDFKGYFNYEFNASNHFTCLEWDKYGRMWCGVNDKNGLFLFDPETSSFTHYDDGRPLSVGVKTLLVDKNNMFWFGHRGVGFARFKPRKGQFNYYPVKGNGKGILGSFIYDLEEVDSVNLFIGIDQAGINVFNRKTRRFTYITDDNHFYGNLSSNGIYCIYKDDEGIIWTGTSRGGVCYHNPKQSRFKTYIPRVKSKKSTTEGGYYPSYGLHSSYYESEDGKIWIGTDGGGINILNPKTGKFSYIYEVMINGKPENLNVIRSITKGGDNNIYITPWEGDMVVYNTKTGRYSKPKFKEPNLMDLDANTFWSTFVDSKKRFWVSYTYGTIALYDKNKKWLGKFYVGDSTNYMDVKIQETKDSLIYLLTRNGIHQYNDSLNKLNKIIDVRNLVYMDVLEDGSIWFASDQEGLFYYNRERKKVERIDLPFNANQVLVRSLAYCKNKVYIATNHGILIYDIKTKKTQSFDKEDGLQGNEFFHQAVLKTSDGKIYFGGNNGSTMIDPSNLGINTFVPPVYISDIYVSHKKQELHQEASILKNNVLFTKDIELKWRSNLSLELEFVALNFTFPYKNEYAYMLEGMDEEWQNSSSYSRRAVYTNLRPGEYIFKVKACNNDGVWNENETKLNIIIHPPFWFTSGFFLACGVALLLILYLIIVIRERRIVRDKERLKKKVAKRTELIEQQKEQLDKQNKELEHHYEELAMKQEELQVQNEELFMHRNNLQILVDEKTKDLLEAKLRAELSDRLKSSFLANMSHEIRTPMNAIIGFSNLLVDDNINEEERKQFVSVITDNSEVLLHLVEDILDFSLIESNQMKISNNELDLNHLLESIFSSFVIREKQIPSVELLLNNHLQQHKVKLKSDEYRIRQIISNLIGNAFKFTTEGSIEIGCRLNMDNVELYVKDTGIGMSNEEQAIVFQQFVKLDKEKFYNKRGIGLGLSISKRLAVLLGGDLLVKSTIDKGSEFILTIPYKNKGLV
ncbi:sensor histidine kinase [Labilibacter marinus]|uniref:sensor histidine kinase n=1 Tax=Labilibacter marinus TaxID=1477105 RepID=UPI001301498B|nr:two-component regulator propeller domain-containing protein [Labilibacter marinus]